MSTFVPVEDLLEPSETPGKRRCSHFADGSSVCVGKDGITLAEAQSPYLVKPYAQDSEPEKPTP